MNVAPLVPTMAAKTTGAACYIVLGRLLNKLPFFIRLRAATLTPPIKA